MASPSSPETNIASGKDVDVIKQELDELQKKNKKLQEEKESLQIRVQGVQTLGSYSNYLHIQVTVGNFGLNGGIS